ncbi:reverse transcriptase domain-containing protein [Tanacetum coccineum]
MPNLKPTIPYPSRRNDERRREKTNDQIKKFYKIFKDLSFEISLTDALILMPKFALTLKALIGNKEKLSEMARTPLNEHFLVVILNKLPKKLGDPGKFLIPCDFPEMDECLALYSQKFLGFPMDLRVAISTSLLMTRISFLLSPTLTPFGDSDFLLLEEADAFLALEDDPTLPEELKVCEAKTDKSSIDEPPGVELKDLPPHLEYAFLEGDEKFPVIIAKDLSIEEKAALIKVLKSRKRAIALKLSDIKGINPEFCTHKILMEDDYKPEEGIVLGHKISKNMIEVDKAKVDVIAKLHHPTTVKGVRSFLGHVGFYRRFIKDFSKISRPMAHLLEKNTPFIFSNECIQAFNTLKKKLTEAPILIALDWDLPFELMCDASDFAIGAVLGQRHEKHFRPIHYASKTMNEAESHYTTTEKEMLAVL